MAQSWWQNLIRANMTLWRPRVNSLLATLRSNFSGTSAPTNPAPVAGQLFAQVNGSDNVTALQVFNGGTETWTDINLGSVIYDPSSVDINGGTIDGTVIGGASSAAGTFTAVESGDEGYQFVNGDSQGFVFDDTTDEIRMRDNAGTTYAFKDAAFYPTNPVTTTLGKSGNYWLELHVGSIRFAFDSTFTVGTSSVRASNVYTDAVTCTNTVTANGFEGAAMTLTGTAGTFTTDLSNGSFADIEIETDDGSSRLYLRSYRGTSGVGNLNATVYEAAGGTISSPSAISDGVAITAIAARAHDGTDFESGALARFVADGDWTGSNRGCYYSIELVANGSTTRSESMRVYNGHVDIVDGYLELDEISAPSSPAANKVRIWAEDNGAGKTMLMARFSSGAAQQIAIQP
jgi:hypothetical protein